MPNVKHLAVIFAVALLAIFVSNRVSFIKSIVG